ncbi:MAG TPA: ABC transporter substrate-binding protein [Acidimicrobiales bacterium]|nr:ABC transporter substrate-binding protein [Acidimicrobiales bacterium]
MTFGRHIVRWRAGRVAAAVASLGIGVALVTAPASPVGAAGKGSKSPIVIGLVGSLTGVASSTFTDGPGGALARIDLQNARGGIDGHPLKLEVADDQSNPTQVVTASQDLVENKGAIGLIMDGPFGYAAAAYTHSRQIPVTTDCACGPQFAQLPYTNLFSYSGGGSPTIFNGLMYTNTADAIFLKEIGVTKLAGLGYGISAASIDSVKLLFGAAQRVGGISQCYTNYSIPFGGVDFTASTLQIKSAGCNGVVGSFVDASDVALAQAVKNAGIAAKQLYFTGYDEDVLTNPTAARAFDGVYVTSGINFTTPNGPTRAMLATLRKYDKSYTGGIPDLGLYGSYLAADNLIKGLQMAGRNLTSAAVIAKLRTLKSYNAGGILPSAVTFQHFGTPAMLPKHPCTYVMQLQGSNFVVYKNKPICGTEIGVPGIA